LKATVKGAAVIALAVLVAACGSSSSSTAASGSRLGVEYASCMRSHGVPRYPDPSSGNQLANGLPKVSPRQLDVSDAQYQAAQGDCAHLLPNGGQQTQPQSQRDLDAMRAYARCMRAHGVPTWPDPTFDPTAGWGFNLVGVHGFDPNSQLIDDKMDVCDRALPPGTGVPLSRPGHPG
jgi:hypothetical protein